MTKVSLKNSEKIIENLRTCFRRFLQHLREDNSQKKRRKRQRKLIKGGKLVL